MRQVPTYLILGSGRVARHLRRYFDLLGLSYQTWSRRENTPEELSSLAASCSPILLLIKDAAIAEFIEQHPFLKEKTLIHFSGQLYLEGVHSAHPLMTFAAERYSLEAYQKMPFILGDGSPALTSLLPGLPNPSAHLPEKERSYYHALCVLGGNYTVLLWQKLFKEFEARLNLPKELAHAYLAQVVQNLMTAPDLALTGPLVRGDQKTLAAHLQVLEGDDYQGIYQAFVDMYQKTRGQV